VAGSRVSLNMQKRWRVVLPIIGMVLFSAVTSNSLRFNQKMQRAPSRYFWWSAIRLDSDPANQRKWGPMPCESGKENWVVREIWVDPGLLEEFLILSAFPAFVLGGLVVALLGKLRISEVSSFMLLMPILILAWYFFIGWLLDRRIRRRVQPSIPTPV
jgi:hypothetical protein